MLLAFSQKFKDNTPTYFIEKIWRGLFLNGLGNGHLSYKYDCWHKNMFGAYWDGSILSNDYLPIGHKLHTIRAGARWEPGDIIHFCINARTPNYFQFAPVVEVVSVQSIEIKWIANLETGKGVTVCIDGEYHVDIAQLAQNDGFPSVEAFFNWFSEDFTGQIIHWTSLKY